MGHTVRAGSTSAGALNHWILLQELGEGRVLRVFQKPAPGSPRSAASFSFLSRRQMELLLPVVIGCPKYLHRHTALSGCGRAGGPGHVPGQHVLLLPAAWPVLGLQHAPAARPHRQPEQGYLHCGRQDLGGKCIALCRSRDFGVCAFKLLP